MHFISLQKVDFEDKNHYRIIAKVRNLHVDEQLIEYHMEPSTTVIMVQVGDEDEPPVFRHPYYLFEIYEGRPRGSFVGVVSATDPDQRKSPVGYVGMTSFAIILQRTQNSLKTMIEV